jgi:uncharacterized protein YndB with AHSA1/START domain
MTPIVKVVFVRATPAQAFRRFTSEMATWWPLSSHSVGEDRAESVVMEERVGGRIVEHIRGGRDAVWGTITAWDPPRRVAFSWHPGDDPARAQDVEVCFTPAGERTRVELQHRGFERLGAEARRARRMYPIGWTYVLGLYARQRGPLLSVLRGLTSVLMGVRRRRLARQAAPPSAP